MSQAAPKRPYAPRMPGEQRREQILDTALELINAGGVEAVTVDAVAKAIDVTRPVVYSQFSDANHILRDLLEREGEQALAQLRGVVPPDLAGADPAAALTTMTRELLKAVQERPSRWRSILLPAHGGSPPALQKFKRQAEALLLDRLVEILRALLGDRADGMDVELTAHVLFRGWEEAGRLALADPGAYPVERLAAFAGSLFSAISQAPSTAPQPVEP
ncbi:MAG: TetR/AcrR family transcriptional regulator [Segniliparus sp.]|uniref:TetR/AcrR family transcriptional regulator n=1 Tax=Segniliparus sp. TaxID=2804064 RepID=UPI003F33C73A